jgi:hypothetical protein
VLLSQHHIDKVPVTTICEGAGLQPSVFYRWQRELVERAAHILGAHRRAVRAARRSSWKESWRRPRRGWRRRTR